MIIYEKSILGSFTVYSSAVKIGDIHRKKFVTTGISPLNQETLNLYAGNFNFSIPSIGFSQDMLPGQSSLDLTITEYPLGAICEERPLSESAMRYCISPTNKAAKWKRRTHVFTQDASALSIPQGSVVFTVAGECTECLNGGVLPLLTLLTATEVCSKNATIVVIELVQP